MEEFPVTGKDYKPEEIPADLPDGEYLLTILGVPTKLVVKEGKHSASGGWSPIPADVFFRERAHYTIETLPADLPAGKYPIMLNGKDVELLIREGIPYLSMAHSALLVDRSRSGLQLRIQKEEDKHGKQLRWNFGSLEVWLKLEDLKKIYFTPKPSAQVGQNKKSGQRIKEQQ